MENYLWLIPFLPACGALICLLVGRSLPRLMVSIIACGTVLASFILSVLALVQLLGLPQTNRAITQVAYTWLAVGTLKIQTAFLIDPLSAIMLLVVTGVGFLIHLYSIGYMADDKRYSRYFGFLNLFIFAMVLLVSGNNLLIMFVGWEGVGLCSYLLIGFWFEKTANAVAGMKAFIVNRIGDFGFIVGIFLLFWAMGKAGGIWTLDFGELRQNVHLLTGGMATAVGLLLFIGACGKSAQIPLYVWLPDAMAGPTPVSALIHAATMVTAGVYMIARLNFIYVLSPTAMTVVAVVGIGTALFAGTIGLLQKDIKRVLAYSTISQLGYMFLGVGVGAFAAGIFHLMTHAFFKALLFLGSGSVIHGTGGEQDIDKMGGLKKYMPITFWTFLIGTLAIAGLPGLAGFFSKDAILWGAFSSKINGHWILWVLGVLGAGLTALYMFRLLFITFFGKNRSGHEEHQTPHIHESPWVMTIPLIILAVLSIIGGYIGIPSAFGGVNSINSFEQFLGPTVGQEQELIDTSGQVYMIQKGHELEILLMIISMLVVLVSIGLAYYLYIRKPELPKRLARKFDFAYCTVFNKYYIDEIYQKVVVNNLLRLNDFLAFPIDLGIIDWLVNATGRGTVKTSDGSGWVDNTFVDGAVNGTAETVLSGGNLARMPQTGILRNYLTWAVAGLVILIIAAFCIMHFA